MTNDGNRVTFLGSSSVTVIVDKHVWIIIQMS